MSEPKPNLIIIQHNYCGDLGMSSYFLRTLAKIHNLEPERVYIDWSASTWYQNPGERKNIWELIFHQPEGDYINFDNYNISYTSSWIGNEAVPNKDNLPISKDAYSRAIAADVIAKNFKLKSEIKTVIDAYYDQNLKGKKCLAIHRRGCIYNGKHAMPIEIYNNKLLDIIKSGNFDCAFVCTDNIISKNEICDFLRLHEIPVYVYDSDISRTIESFARPWDSDVQDKNLLAKEVFIEIYLMSMCHSIARTESGPPTVVLYINPTIEEYFIEQ